MKILLLLLALSPFALAQNQFFVSPTGSGSSCTSGSKCSINQGLTTAAANLGSGDVTVTADCGNYGAVAFSGSGSSSHQIILISANPASYCSKITGTTGDAVHFGTGSTAHGGNYLTIKGFEITCPTCDQGVDIQGNHDQVLANKIHDIQRGGTCPDGGGAGVAIQWNGVKGTGPNDPTGINFNLVDSNIIYNIGEYPTLCNFTHGIYPSAPYNTTSNNVVFHTAGNGISTYHYTTNQIIAFNSVFETNGPCIFISAKDVDDDFNTVVGNIAANCNRATSSGGIRATAFPATGTSFAEGSHNFFDHNIVYGAVGGSYNLSGTTATNQLSGSNSSTFLLYTGDISGNYKPKVGSNAGSACASGVSGCVPTKDLLGTLRASPTAIGAFEAGSGSSGVVPNPPTGPSAVVN